MFSLSLRDMFFTGSSRPDLMETLRVPLDINQSPNFVSYRAIKNWLGLYNFEKCLFIPTSLYKEREEELKRYLLETDISLFHPHWRDTSYVSIKNGVVKKNISYADALAQLQIKQNELGDLRPSEGDYKNLPPSYFANLQPK